MEADARDRQREREEIEDIRRKLLEEGHPDLEAEMAKASLCMDARGIALGSWTLSVPLPQVLVLSWILLNLY